MPPCDAEEPPRSRATQGDDNEAVRQKDRKGGVLITGEGVLISLTFSPADSVDFIRFSIRRFSIYNIRNGIQGVNFNIVNYPKVFERRSDPDIAVFLLHKQPQARHCPL